MLNLIINNHSFKKPIVLTIAGFDPSSGAGLTADIRTFENVGVYGMSICTALTIQDAENVIEWNPISSQEIRKQMEIVFKSYNIEKADRVGNSSHSIVPQELEIYVNHPVERIYYKWPSQEESDKATASDINQFLLTKGTNTFLLIKKSDFLKYVLPETKKRLTIFEINRRAIRFCLVKDR